MDQKPHTPTEIIKYMKLQADHLGLPAFSLGFFVSPKIIQWHFQNQMSGPNIALMMAGLHQAVEADMRAHPDYPQERIDALKGFSADVAKALDACNKKLLKIKIPKK